MLTRVASIKQVARQAAAGLDVSAIDVSSANGGGNAGGPGQVVTISLTYTVKFTTPIIGQFFQNGKWSSTVHTTFKNEPFPPSQTT